MNEIVAVSRLVGRSGVVTAVIDCLLDPDGPGVLILGDAGMGKTVLANEALGEVGQRVRVFRIYAGSTLAAVPYGALAPLLTSLKSEQTDAPIAVLRALLSELAPEHNKPLAPAMLIVEDAHYLDESSIAIIAQLAAAQTAKVMFLCRPHPVPPQEVLSMWSDGLLDRFELESLTVDEIHQLCVQHLGSQVLPSASAVLGRHSGGNPMFLLELIEHAKQSGQLTLRNNVWVLIGDVLASTLGLKDLVRNQILELDIDQREALEMVALAEPLRLRDLQQAADSRAIDKLNETKFITISVDEGRHVRITQPLVGEVIRQLVPAARSMSIRKRIVSLTDSAPESLEGLLRHVTWARDSGADIDDSYVLKAAEVANRLYLPEYAERVAGSITETRIMPAAQVEIARAKFYRGDVRGADETLAGVVKYADDRQAIRQASLLRGQVAISRGTKFEEILRAAEEWRRAIDRIAGGSCLELKLEIDRVGSNLLSLLGAHAAERQPETESELRRVWDTSFDDETRIVAGTMLTEVLALTGRPVSALQIIMDVQEILAANRDRHIQHSEFVLRRYVLALLYAGELRVLTIYLQDYVQQAQNSLIYFGGLLNLTQGMSDLRLGDMGSALLRLRQAVEGLRVHDIGRDLPLALAATAYAASVLERPDITHFYAEAYSAETAVFDRAPLMCKAYIVAARASEVGVQSSVAELIRLADEAAQAGLVGPEMDILSLVLRLGDLSVARRLAAVAGESEGRWAESSTEFATALTLKDAGRLIELSEAAAQDGFILTAVDCAAYALRFLEARGDRGRQHDAQKLLRRRTAALGTSGPSAMGASRELQKLTRRDLEIARLVHAGCSNKDIAIQLSLSLRTVEGHLYRMFSRLGVGHREELTKVVFGSTGGGGG